MTVVPDDFEVPFGKARVRREGTDFEYYYLGKYSSFLLEWPDKLAEEGIDS
jgi:2-oxoisovalerate dehydrogenase E1 component